MTIHPLSDSMPDKLRIAFLDVYNPIPINSGGDWYRFYLLSELGKGHTVDEYYAVDSNGKEGYRPQEINFNRRYMASEFPLAKYVRSLNIIRPEYLLTRPSYIETPDAVFFSVYYYHIARRLSSKDTIPKVLVMHNVEWQYLKTNNSLLYIPMKIYENYVIRNVDAVVTISQSDYSYVQKMISEEKIFYIPPKVDADIFNPNGPRCDFGGDKYNLLFYGSLDRNQNHEALQFILHELIPAMKTEKMTSNVRITIFGSGTPPEQFGLKDNKDINYLGHVDSPGNYIRAADAVIVPLKNHGGMKIRILEALACGRPVIASTQSTMGLPQELVHAVLIADTAEEYIDTVKQLMTGKISPVIDSNIVLQSLQGKTVENLMNYLKGRAA